VNEIDGMNSATRLAAGEAHTHDLDFLESADLLVRARRPDLQSAGFAHTRAAPLTNQKGASYITDYPGWISKAITSVINQ
jgi:hypothetical protein